MDSAGLEPSWKPPCPSEMPDLRARLIDYLGGPAMHASVVSALGEGRGAISPRTGNLRRDARILMEEELERLKAAELFYVDADMTRLAVAATETLPVHGLHPTDVPAPAGFCVFAEPIATYLNEGGDFDGQPTSIVAVSWGDSPLMRLTRERGLWMTQWTWKQPDAVAAQIHQRHGVPLARALDHAHRTVGPLAWENEVTMLYGATGQLATLTTASNELASVEDVDENTRGADIAGGTMHTGMIVRATWLLMNQPGVADIDTAALSRSERRRAKRDGREPPAVRVVRMIRHTEDHPNPEEGAPARYRVRWTVRGHWRRQWYPSRGDHRPVWINPHLKGPDGAPLHTGQTVHVLDNKGESRRRDDDVTTSKEST
ncbi:hypothetical protein [Actinomycetospora succinea]|nr:hypothetical protein [Actinomycetospora succinea]